MSVEPFVTYSTLKADGVRSLGIVGDDIVLGDALEGADNPYPSPTLTQDIALMPARTVVATWELILRADPSNWQTELQPDPVIVAGDYTATLAGTAYTYTATGGDTLADVLAGLATEINTSAPPNTYIVQNTGTSLVVSNGSAAADTRVAFTVAVTANITAFNDATSIDYMIWIRRGANRWSLGKSVTGRTENASDRVEIGSYDAIYLQVLNSDGRVKRIVSPGVLER